MPRTVLPHFALIFGALVLLLGCTHGKPSLLTVQLCLNNDQGVSEFMNMMRAIAVART